jgi:hypothetical protein
VAGRPSERMPLGAWIRGITMEGKAPEHTRVSERPLHTLPQLLNSRTKPSDVGVLHRDIRPGCEEHPEGRWTDVRERCAEVLGVQLRRLRVGAA